MSHAPSRGRWQWLRRNLANVCLLGALLLVFALSWHDLPEHGAPAFATAASSQEPVDLPRPVAAGGPGTGSPSTPR